MTPEAVLDRDGISLPVGHLPVGTYVMSARSGVLLFVSGHGTFDDCRAIHTGRLGETLDGRRRRGGRSGRAEPVGDCEGRGERPVPCRPLRESGGLRQLRPGLHVATSRCQRSDLRAGARLRRPDRATGSIRHRGGRAAAQVCRGDRGSRRGERLKSESPTARGQPAGSFCLGQPDAQAWIRPQHAVGVDKRCARARAGEACCVTPRPVDLDKRPDQPNWGCLLRRRARYPTRPLQRPEGLPGKIGSPSPVNRRAARPASERRARQ
ncbi:hypothetical protein BH23CHL4_BH23CHL4_30520 [soil metagenome]